MSFLRSLRKPKKSLVLAAALFSVCGLVFAAFAAFTSSGAQKSGSSDLPAPNSAGGTPSEPWLPGDVADISTTQKTVAPKGAAPGPTNHPGAPTGGSFSENSPPSSNGPGNLQGPSDVADPGSVTQEDDLPHSSVFNAEGQNFASAGGSGGGGSGGGGGGPGEQPLCESLIGCTTGSPQSDEPNDKPEDGNTEAGPSNGNPGFTPTTPVPEPETYAMLLAGLGVMAAVARRRKQRTNSHG